MKGMSIVSRDVRFYAIIVLIRLLDMPLILDYGKSMCVDSFK